MSSVPRMLNNKDADFVVQNGYVIEHTETGYRVSLIDDPSVHTHLKTLSGVRSAVDYVISRKIPKRTSSYFFDFVDKDKP